MHKILLDIFHILSKSFRKSIYLFFFLTILSVIFESLGLVILFQAFKLFFSKSEELIDENILSNLFIIFGVELNMENKFLIFPAIIIIYFSKNFYLSFFYWWRNEFVQKIRKDIGNKLFNNYIFKDHIYHVNKNSSELTRNIVVDNILFHNAANEAMLLVSEIFIAICLSGVLIYLEPTLTLTFISLICLLMFVTNFIISKKLVNWGKKKQFFEGRVIKFLNESLRGHKEIKILGIENFFAKYFNLNLHGAARNTQLASFFYELPRLWIEFILILVFCLGFYYLISVQNLSFEEMAPILAIYSGAALRLLPSFNRILTSSASVNSRKAVISLFKKEISEYNQFTFNYKKQISKFDFNRNIIFENLSYSHSGTEKAIINNLNFKVNKNEIIGIVGPSGSGKSTLVNLTMGLIFPSSGKILIDNNPLDLLNARIWQSKIGYVPQSIFFTDDSIKKNIALGLEDEEIDIKKINELIDYCKLSSLIKPLKLNIESKLGELGSKISEGQKQRIGLARALYRDPDILVLDEFTSSLDIETENEILQIIENLKDKKTIFIVSHRKSAIKHCNKVLNLPELNKGIN